MEEYSLGIIKPDGMENAQEILSIIERNGLKIVAIKRMRLTKEMAEIIYKESRERSYFESLINFMTSNECLVFLVKGKNAISKLNKIVGATDPKKAKVGTIRKRFGKDIQRNAIHSSKDKEHFEKERQILFPELELL